MLLLLKMKTEEKVIAKTNGRQPGMKAEILHIAWYNAVLWCTQYSFCMHMHRKLLFSSEVRRIVRGRSNTVDTIFLRILCRRSRVFFAQSINRYSFRVEELSFSSSRLTFSIHLYRNHMAFSMNNTHAHTHKEISNPMRRLSVREYIYNFITCIAIVAIC